MMLASPQRLGARSALSQRGHQAQRARPFRLSRLALTDLVPLIPALVAWDETVSALRAYAPAELLELARSVEGSDRDRFDAPAVGPALAFTAVPRES